MSPPEKQRLRSPEGTPLDLVPFAGVEEEGGKARFPPEGSPELTVLGFEAAWEAALPVRFGEGPGGEETIGEGSGDRGTVFRVASLEGLALLKLVSWNERPENEPGTRRIFAFFCSTSTTGGWS